MRAEPAPTTIAVYHDAGSGEFTRAALLNALAHRFEGKAVVRRIYASEICHSDAWHEGTLLLALPGGADLPYCAQLDGAGNASIRRYLVRGGRLLGICAGAYYASARVAWETQAPDAISGERELACFQGTARGSLHDLAAPYSVEHLHCTAATQLVSEQGEPLCALYWGGPEFLPDAEATYTALLRYAGSGKLAAVSTRVGQGISVLCGVHAEVTGDQLPIEVSHFGDDSFTHGMQVSAALRAHEAQRKRAFDLLIAALEL